MFYQLCYYQPVYFTPAPLGVLASGKNSASPQRRFFLPVAAGDCYHPRSLSSETIMNPLPKIRNPLTSILIGATIISFSGIWVAWAALDPTVSAFYRVFFGTIFLFAGCLWKKEFHKIDIGSSFLLVFCSLSFAADLVCWHAAISFIGPGLATIIGNFQVFILSFIAITFMGERLSLRFIISVPLAITGLLMVIGFNWTALPENYLLGIFLSLLTALFYSVFILSMRRLQANEPQASLFFNLMLVSLLTSLLLIPAILLSGASFAIPALSSLTALVCLALFSQTIGWVVISSSLPRTRASIAGLLLLLQPALSFVWDVLIFKRYTTLLNWTGVALVLAAIYLGMSSTRKAGR